MRERIKRLFLHQNQCLTAIDSMNLITLSTKQVVTIVYTIALSMKVTEHTAERAFSTRSYRCCKLEGS